MAVTCGNVQTSLGFAGLPDLTLHGPSALHTPLPAPVPQSGPQFLAPLLCPGYQVMLVPALAPVIANRC